MRVVTKHTALKPFEVAITLTGVSEYFLTLTRPLLLTETASGFSLVHSTGSEPLPSGARVALSSKLLPTAADCELLLREIPSV